MKIISLVNKLDKIKVKTFFLLSGVIFLALILIGSTFNVVTEIMEVKEIGDKYTSIFWKNFSIKYLTMIGIFIVVYISIYLTNKAIQKNIKKFFEDEKKEPVNLPNKSIAFFIAIVVAFFAKDFLAQNILLFLNSTSFETLEAVFGKDIGYYMFTRPFLMDISNFAKGLILSLIVYTVGYYIVVFGTCFDGIVLSSLKKNNVIKHNIINAIIFLLIVAVSYTFTMEDALFGKFSDKLVGAGYTDITIKLVAYKIARWLIVIVALLTYIFIERNKVKKAVITLLTIPAFWIATYVAILITQSFFVSPNEFSKEQKFIEYNMANTKQAYNINYLSEQTYQPASPLTEEGVTANISVAKNVPIVSEDSTLKALNQNQATKDYYEFTDADLAKYNINGAPNLTYVSARETDTKDMDYINKTFLYTHGFGIVMNAINNTDKDGEPEFMLNEIKDEMSVGELKISQPRIYYGENTEQDVIVNAKGIDEFDYPSKDKSLSTRYEGTAGIQMNFANKVLMAIKKADLKMLVSSYVTSDSKLLLNRNVIDRAKKIAPFLKFDEDAYLVANNEGRLYWVVDAYTMSTNYPYAEYFEIQGSEEEIIEKYNYIRNSAKALIDAYNGDVTFYITDKKDPVILAYNKAYPGLFEDLETEIPDDIKSHIKYPQLLFDIQSKILEKYHVTDVSAFYKGEDVWTVATYEDGKETKKMEPYYAYVKLLDGREEFVLMIPYTPSGRNSLASLFMVEMEGQNYGNKLIYKFSDENSVLGTIQIDNKIDQNSEITKDLSLWSGSGTKITRSIKIIPFGNALLYVEPIYIEAVNEGAIPQVKKVVVAYNNSFAIASTFEEALLKVINNDTGTVKIDLDEIENDNTNLKTTIDQTLTTYQAAKGSMQAGNWEEFAINMNELELLMNKLNEKKAELE